jgi:predicted nucleic acid-binding protein
LTLRATILDRRDVIAVGDLVLCEVLQGLASDREANLVEAAMRRFEPVSMTSPRLAVIAAGHYRTLRRLGITVRKTIDLLIGTFCIDKDMPLLHADRDFEPMAQHLGLRVIATG